MILVGFAILELPLPTSASLEATTQDTVLLISFDSKIRCEEHAKRFRQRPKHVCIHPRRRDSWQIVSFSD